MSAPRERISAVAVALAVAAVATSVFLAADAAPAAAQANPVLTVAPAVLPLDQPTTVIVSGAGYLVPPRPPGANVTGGVYALFGWVASGVPWGPSSRNALNSNGQFGITYSYPGEAGSGETRDDGTGVNRFVSFTAGGVSGNSTPFHMDANGNWRTSLIIGGPAYEWFDPATGLRFTVDCRVVTCGVYTVGAHGRASPTNERFFPLTFTATPAPPTPGATVPPLSAPATAPPAGTPTSRPAPAPTSATRSGSTPATSPVLVAGATTSVVVSTTTLGLPDPGRSAPDSSPSIHASTDPLDESTTTGPATTSTTQTTSADGRDRLPSESAATVTIEPDDDGSAAMPVALGVGALAALAAGSLVMHRRRPRTP